MAVTEDSGCREWESGISALDIADGAERCFGMMRDAADNGCARHELVLSNVSGCKGGADLDAYENIGRLYRRIQNMRNHEEKMHEWAERICDSTDINVLGGDISENILPNSVLAVNETLLLAPENIINREQARYFTDKMVVIASRNDANAVENREVYDLSEMYPGMSEYIAQKVMFVFQSVYSADYVCGYYMVRISDIENDADRICRLCHIINLKFGILLECIRRENTGGGIEQIRTRDPLTGLLNLKGLVETINGGYDEYSSNSIAVSVYAIPRYKYIMENFGLDDAEEAVHLTAEALKAVNTDNVLISRIAEDEFIIINFVKDASLIGATIDHATSTFFRIIEDYNKKRDKEYFVEINCGCVVSMPGWEKDIMSFIKAANGEMYLNKLKNGSTPALKKEKSHEDYYRIFDLLIEKNLFIYYFQPIVNAHTGEIYAYEALMRTDSSINMNPLQILSVAGEYNRLYDVERATLFNVMGYMDEHYSEFEGKRVFINTIPGCFLNEEDNELLVQKYEHLFAYCTIEITEQNETNDAELMQIKRLESNRTKCQLAIDDYGTGFSNIVNLLLYQPQVIKIDRYLISDVHNDTNKQLFIGSTVEFARLNNILVLAEGVETKEELSKVIELGVDLIQGYYTARPSAEVISDIDSDISAFIVEENERIFKSAGSSSIYQASNGEVLELSKISGAGYIGIELVGGSFIFKGIKNKPVDLTVVTAPESDNEIVFEDVYISTDGPAVILGDRSRNVITLCGDNYMGEGHIIGCEGIKVPAGTELTLNGDGGLSIFSTANAGVSVGGTKDDYYGSITVDIGGNLNISSIGSNPICIGGGYSSEADIINIVRGSLKLEAKGVHSVGIGSVLDWAAVRIGELADVKICISGNESVAVGNLSGTTDVVIKGKAAAEIEGEKSVGIGVLNGGYGQILLGCESVNVTVRGERAVCVGSVEGHTDIHCVSGVLKLRAEGANAGALGNYRGAGQVIVAGGTVHTSVWSDKPVNVGDEGDIVLIDGGDVIDDRVAANQAGIV